MLDRGLESVARAMAAEYSSDRSWESRHPKNRAYWMAVAESVMGLTAADPAFGYIMDRAHGRKPAHLELFSSIQDEDDIDCEWAEREIGSPLEVAPIITSSPLYALLVAYLRAEGFHQSGANLWGHPELGEGRTFDQVLRWQIGREMETRG